MLFLISAHWEETCEVSPPPDFMEQLDETKSKLLQEERYLNSLSSSLQHLKELGLASYRSVCSYNLPSAFYWLLLNDVEKHCCRIEAWKKLDDYALCLSDIARHPRSSSSTSRRVVLQSMNFVRNLQVECLTGC